jgi:hypothetical protein
MSAQRKPIQELVNELPRDAQEEVRDFVEFLLAKRAKSRTGRLKLDWMGGLADLKDRYSSVELQHKAMEWLGSDVSP